LARNQFLFLLNNKLQCDPVQLLHQLFQCRYMARFRNVPAQIHPLRFERVPAKIRVKIRGEVLQGSSEGTWMLGEVPEGSVEDIRGEVPEDSCEDTCLGS
jgi:hypothetical protein